MIVIFNIELYYINLIFHPGLFTFYFSKLKSELFFILIISQNLRLTYNYVKRFNFFLIYKEKTLFATSRRNLIDKNRCARVFSSIIYRR